MHLLVHTDSVKLNTSHQSVLEMFSIDVNGANYEVFYSDQHSIQSLKNMGEVVCRELGCGKVLAVKQGSSTSNGLLSNVECQDNEQSLWHCLQFVRKNNAVEPKLYVQITKTALQLIIMNSDLGHQIHP